MKILKMNNKLSNRFFLKSIAIFFIFALTIIIFANSVHNDFTNWDDNDLILNNMTIRTLDFKGLKRIFDPAAGGTYQPMRVLSYAIDYSIGGFNPVVYHIHNILLHAFAGVFLFLSLCCILPQLKAGNEKKPAKGWLNENKHILISLIVASLFIAHPINVEAVTWLSSRKYVLLCFFSFLSLFIYVKNTEREKDLIWLNLLSVLFFIAAVFSSPFGVVLPALFLFFEICRHDTFNLIKVIKDRFVSLSPYIVLGVVVFLLLWTKLVQTGGGASKLHFKGDIVYTIYTIFQALFDYLRNFLVPLWLNNRYVDYIYLSFFAFYKVWMGALLVVFTLAVSIWAVFKNNRLILFSLGWLFIAWLPTSNIIPISTKMADRYIYLASPGFFLLLVNSLLFIYDRAHLFKPPLNKVLANVQLFIFFLLFSGLVFLTIQRNQVWKDSGTLWNDSLNKDFQNVIAHTNLGSYLFIKGDLKEAERHLKIAHIVDKSSKVPLDTLGRVLFLQHKFDEAIATFKMLTIMDPSDIEAYGYLARIYLREGQPEKAATYIDKLIEANPENGEALSLQGAIFYDLKRYEEAAIHFKKSIKLFPENSELRFNYGLVLEKQELYNEAMSEFETAVTLKPLYAEAYEQIGKLHERKGLIDDAIEDYQKALKCNSGIPSIHNNLGNAFFKIGRSDKALESYSKAVEINSDFKIAKINVCVIYESKGLTSKAFDCYKEINENYKDSAMVVNNMGNILAGEGKIDEAVTYFKDSLKIDPAYPDANFNLGNIYYMQENWDAAMARYIVYLNSVPDDVAMLQKVASVHIRKEDYESAAKIYERITGLLPNNSNAFYIFGVMKLKIGQRDIAVELLHKALALDPENRQASYILTKIGQ